MTTPLVRTAIVYDFDGTLAQGNVQEHKLLPYLGESTQSFWNEVQKRRKMDDADQVLIYMELILELAKAKNLPITRCILANHGSEAPLFDGVTTWFDRINEHAAARGLALEHYVISAGNEEIILGTPIAKSSTSR